MKNIIESLTNVEVLLRIASKELRSLRRTRYFDERVVFYELARLVLITHGTKRLRSTDVWNTVEILRELKHQAPKELKHQAPAQKLTT